MKKTEKPEPISARAVGLLILIITQDFHISGEALAQHVKEGEKAIQSSLRELRAYGYLELKKTRAQGRVFSSTQVTDRGYQFFIQLFTVSLMNDHWFNVLIKPDNAKELHKFVRLKRVPSPSLVVVSPKGFSDPLLDSSLEPEEESSSHPSPAIEGAKQVKFEEGKQKVRKRKFEARQGKPMELWTATDVSFEFADRLQEIWQIKPWRVTKSKFTPALSQARKTYETNGEMEVRMIERFLSNYHANPHTDANIVWKQFIAQYSSLAKWAYSTRPKTADEMEEIRKQAEESWKGL